MIHKAKYCHIHDFVSHAWKMTAEILNYTFESIMCFVFVSELKKSGNKQNIFLQMPPQYINSNSVYKYNTSLTN